MRIFLFEFVDDCLVACWPAAFLLGSLLVGLFVCLFGCLYTCMFTYLLICMHNYSFTLAESTIRRHEA